MHHQFRARGEQRGEVLGPSYDTDEPRADPLGGFAREPHRPAGAVIAADHQHVPVQPFVGGGNARRQAVGDIRLRDPSRLDGQIVGQLVRHVERFEDQFADDGGPGAGKKPWLEADEGHGQRRAHHGTGGCAGVGDEPRGDIHGHDRRSGGIHRGDGVGERSLGCARKSDTKERIHDQIRFPRSDLFGCKNFTARLPPGGCGGSRRASFARRFERGNTNVKPGLAGEPCDDIPVAAVVPAAGIDEPASRFGPARVDRGKRRLPGPLHQQLAGQVGGGGTPIEFGQFASAVKRRGKRIHEIIIKMTVDVQNSPGTKDYTRLAEQLHGWACELGFDAVGVSDIALDEAEARLERWLAEERHGEMGWMERHGRKRSRPAELLPGTLRVISVRMNYLSTTQGEALAALANPECGYIARYALGRDYHKLVRKRLQKLADKIGEAAGAHGYRVFSDSAPVLEKPLAAKAGLGWVGKHTLVLERSAGSYFFLGEIYTDLPLPVNRPASAHCGSCRRCIDICPTGAITAPGELDARRCIAYLTIEHRGPIPVELRPLIGNRVFGCDDCQLVCPWNRYARQSREAAFAPRESLRSPKLVELFGWSEARFLAETEGNPLRRIGYTGFLRNVAVALGNAPPSTAVKAALEARLNDDSELLREHIRWALARQSGAALPINR